MTLAIDDRVKLQGQPGLHALIVGISAYRYLPPGGESSPLENFGLLKPSSAAVSGYAIYNWLLQRYSNPQVPIATCRLMLSPSEKEMTVEPGLGKVASSCTLDDFIKAASEWRNDASTDQRNMTFFYFAGHGLRRNQVEDIILLEDFGSGIGPMLRNTVSINNIFNGMAPNNRQQNIARTQLYFIDASRVSPSRFSDFEFMNTTPIFDVFTTGPDERSAVVFNSAAPGQMAWSSAGQVSFFTKALIEGLNNDAAVRVSEAGWGVTVHSLANAVDLKLKYAAQQAGVEQNVTVGGLVRDVAIHFLDSPPIVDVAFELEPSEASSLARLEIQDEGGEVVLTLPQPVVPHPYHAKLAAGYYSVTATIDPPKPHFFTQRRKFFEVLPPLSICHIKVAQ